MRYSIRWQLICIMCAFIAVALGGTLLLIRPIIAADYEQRIQTANAAMADSLSRNIEQFIKTEEVIAGTTAEYPGLLLLPKNQRREILARAVAVHPSIQRISVTDLSGNQLGRSEGLETNRRQAEWYKTFMEQHRPSITGIYYPPSNQEMPAISIIYGIHYQKELTGLLQAVVNMDTLQRIVADYQAEAGGYAFLLSSDGALLAHPDVDQVKQLYNYRSFTRQILHRQEDGDLLRDSSGEIISEPEPFPISASQRELIEQALAGGSGSGEYEDADGQRYLCAYRPVRLTGMAEPWHLFVVQKRSTALAFLQDVTATSVTMSMAVMVLAALLIILFSKRITRPLELMSAAAEKIKTGDLSVEVPVSRQRELGNLAEAFNDMVRGLRHLQREQLQTEERIRSMAYHDPLTGLPNRASLNKFLGNVLRESAGTLSGTILFIDLDDFKGINDCFGHVLGDAVLVEAGKRIRQAAGERAFACRLGGDEFVVAALTGEPVHYGIEMASRIVEALQRECRLQGLEIPLSGSVGIAVISGDCSSVDDLLHEADGAMYAAKHAGRNCWKLYEPGS